MGNFFPDDENYDDFLDNMFAESSVLSEDEYYEQMEKAAILLDSYGFRDADSFIVDANNIDDQYRRSITFDNFEDALAYLIDGGILHIGRVAYDEDEDEYGVAIEPTTP